MIMIDDSTAVPLGVTSFVLFVVLYVWTALGLSAVFRKSGEEEWKAWVPILNHVVLLQLGGLSGWLYLLILIPIVGPLLVWAALIVACYRINVAFGHGAGLTVVAALLLPLWASILGFGPARWLGADTMAGPRSAAPRGTHGGAPHRTPTLDDDAFVPRVTPPAYSPSLPFPAAPPGKSTPPPVPPTAFAAGAGRTAFEASRFEPLDFDSERVTDYPSSPPGPPASARPAPPAIRPAPPLPWPAASGPSRTVAEPTALPPQPPLPAQPPRMFVEPPAEEPGVAEPSSAERTRADAREERLKDWGGFDLGAVSELTSEVTAADSAAPGPISAVPVRDSDDDASAAAGPPVTRGAASPPVSAPVEPWTPVGAPRVDGDAFPENSGPVSAIVVPDAAIPRSARGSVSAQHAKDEIPEDPFDQTIITRRRRTAWSLIPPSGSPVAITSDVLIVGRRPDLDSAYPGAQLVRIDDGTVSKTHARLELRDDRWHVTDLGSTNGVLFATLMGTEVEAPPGVEVEAGERFFLGDAEVRLQRSDG